ncbi:MAG: glycosyltransferase family 2 protein [Elusimicrobia bacterium]|nr:glycosyltransferase family 2 protein [Candidatus Liberimonas magnetica]
MKLSVIIPCYNEKDTILKMLDKINGLSLPVEKEVLVVDDGSKDGTAELLKDYLKTAVKNEKVIFHSKNAGKGRAIRTAAETAGGDYLIIQDADFELDPDDYTSLLKPVLEGRAKVVFGSRKLKGFSKIGFLSRLANYIFTKLTNFLYGSSLTDQACGYKLVPVPLFRELGLKCTGFEFCAELTAKILQRKYDICEVPVEYYPRTYSQGKKIKWKDGFVIIWTLLKYKIGHFL